MYKRQDEKADRGISTAYIADAMELQRTNVSSILNLLVQEGRIQKCNGRPVLYKVGREESTLEECFSDLIGADGSLRQTIQLAKAAVLYPQRSLNTLLVGARGTGKSRLAQRMYRFAVEQKILPENAPFLHIDCHDYAAGGEAVSYTHLLEWKEALRGLDEKYRLIVVLFYADGLRTAEIGKLLQLPDSTVRTRLARGREQLAKYYAETEEGGGRK